MKAQSLPRALLSLVRVKQWIKNFFVLFPLVFSISFFEASLVVKSLLVFGAFCFASAAGYIVNDVLDRERDRLHPRKMHRPIAAGTIAVPFALALAGALLALGLCLALLTGWPAAVVVASYVILSISYSLFLKHAVLIDVMAIAFGFVLRVTGGALAIGVHLSSWFLLATLFLSLFMGLGKRRHDFVHLTGPGARRPVLEKYSLQLLDYCIVVCVALIIITYSLYTAAEETVRRFRTGALIYTVPLVVYGVFRYLFLVYKKEDGGDPSEIVLRDPSLIVCVLLWGAAVLVILTLGHWGYG